MFFWRSQIWILSLQSGLGRQILKLTPILICSLKIMGKNLQNELWAMGMSTTFEIVRTPASYIISRSGHGKWEKTGSFRILANFPDSKNFKRYPGYAIGNLTSRAFWKCGSFCCYNFLNRSYGCSKSTESEILAMLAKIRGVKKKTRLQFYVSGSAIESAS